jgi:hypothetical protein
MLTITVIVIGCSVLRPWEYCKLLKELMKIAVFLLRIHSNSVLLFVYRRVGISVGTYVVTNFCNMLIRIQPVLPTASFSTRANYTLMNQKYPQTPNLASQAALCSQNFLGYAERLKLFSTLIRSVCCCIYSVLQIFVPSNILFYTRVLL